MLSGDNGILQRATDAKTESEKGQEKEIVALAYNSALTKKVGNGDSTPVTSEDMNTELTNQGATASGSTTITVTFEKSKRQYTINDNGSIEYAGTENSNQDEDTPKLELTIAGDGISTAIPPNPDASVFEYKEGNVEIGYVIRDKNNGNEFVWVPVEKNQKIALNVIKKETITDIKLIDPSGAEMNLNLPETIGNSFKKENIEPTYNGVYKIKVTTERGTEEKSLLVRSLYAADTFNDYYTDEYYDTDDVINYWRSCFPFATSDEFLFSVLSNTFAVNITNREEFNNWAKGKDRGIEFLDLEDYKNSVNTNGGFYISRYEAGINVQRTSGNRSTDGKTMISPLSVPNVYPYNNITVSQAKDLSEKMYSGKSHLMTNAAWDRTLGWIIQTTNNVNLSDVILDSKGWGNYSDSSFNATGTGNLAKTGAFGDSTKVNNIYDLAGNVYEFTSAQNADTRIGEVYRGGYFTNTGSITPASIREGQPHDSEGFVDDCAGFRVALFL